MTRAEQKRFIRDLTARVRADALKASAKFPEHWDGIELRQYLADKFAACVFKGTMDRQRLRDYRNLVLVENL